MTTTTRRRTASFVIALTGIIHLVLAPEYLSEEAYIGLLFIAAAVTCGGVAAVLWRRNEPIAWGLGALTCAGMFVGFVLSRTVGLPDFHEAEWELSGLITLVADAGFVGLAALGLRQDLPAAATS